MDVFIIGLGIGFAVGAALLWALRLIARESDEPLPWGDLIEEQKRHSAELIQFQRTVPRAVTRLTRRERTIEL